MKITIVAIKISSINEIVILVILVNPILSYIISRRKIFSLIKYTANVEELTLLINLFLKLRVLK